MASNSILDRIKAKGTAAGVPVGTTYGSLNIGKPSQELDNIKEYVDENLRLKAGSVSFKTIGSTLAMSYGGLTIYIVEDKLLKESKTQSSVVTKLNAMDKGVNIPFVISMADFTNNQFGVLSLFDHTAGFTAPGIGAQVAEKGTEFAAVDYHADINLTNPRAKVPNGDILVHDSTGGGALGSINKFHMGICYNAPTKTGGIMPKVDVAIKPCYYLTASNLKDGAISDPFVIANALVAMVGTLGAQYPNQDWLSDVVGVGMSFKVNGPYGFMASLLDTPSAFGCVTAFDDIMMLLLELRGYDIHTPIAQLKQAYVNDKNNAQSSIGLASFQENSSTNITWYADWFQDGYPHLIYTKPKAKEDIAIETALNIKTLKAVTQFTSAGKNISENDAINVTRDHEGGTVITATLSPMVVTHINKCIQQNRNANGSEGNIIGSTKLITNDDLVSHQTTNIREIVYTPNTDLFKTSGVNNNTVTDLTPATEDKGTELGM